MMMFMRMMMDEVEDFRTEDSYLVSSSITTTQAANILMESIININAMQLTHEKAFLSFKSSVSRWRLCQNMSLGLVAFYISNLFP